MPKRCPLPFVVVVSSILTLGCAPEAPPLDCEFEPEVSAMATFRDEPHSFEEAMAVLYLAGTPEDSCVHSAHLSLRNDETSMEVYYSRVEGDPDRLRAAGVAFDRGTFPNYPEDADRIFGELVLEDRDDACGIGAADLTISSLRTYMEASEDWGPYTLSQVSAEFSGPWEVAWVDMACN